MFFKWKPEIARTVTAIELELWLNLATKGHNTRVRTRDSVYRIPANPADIMKRSPARKMKYIKNRRDCEDFVRRTLGWLSEKALGDLVAMDCTIEFQGKPGHALMAYFHPEVVYADRLDRLIFGEPQTGKLVEDPGKGQPFRISELIA